MELRRVTGVLLVAGLAAAPAPAGDWPCWRGPDRTGVSAETGLLRQWPDGGPPLAWQATGLGNGYSTPSVAGGRLFVMGSRGDTEFLHALDVASGKLLWSTKVGLVGENIGPNYPGPRSTPTVDGDRVFTLGSDGDLVCAEAATGEVVWRRHLLRDFDGKRGTWAYAESVLIDGDTLVCTPGGDTATMAALDKRTGAVKWKAVREDYNTAGYASPVVAELGGVRQYVQFLGSGLIGVATADGRLLWKYNRHVGGISAACPVVHDGCVFSTASGGDSAGGDALVRPEPDGRGGQKATQLYLARVLMNHHGGVVRVGDHVYGTSGPALVCMEFRTGKRAWRERSGVRNGSILAADGHLYVRGDDGGVLLAEATPAGLRVKGRLRQPRRSEFPAFCHPVVAGGRLYLRDDDLLFCYDVRER